MRKVTKTGWILATSAGLGILLYIIAFVIRMCGEFNHPNQAIINLGLVGLGICTVSIIIVGIRATIVIKNKE